MRIVTVGLAGALLGLLAAAAAPARAQQPWLPFRPGSAAQFEEAATPGDTTHVLQVGMGAPVAGSATDSLYRFNGRVLGCPATIIPSHCYFSQRLRADNLFGAVLRSQPRAVFTFGAANGRSLTVRPRAALGVAWATGLPGLSASVSSRALAPVLGSAPDSVAVIIFSDGAVLRLSKSYGLLGGPSLDSYLNGRNGRRALTLSALPARRIGQAVTTVQAVYDFQPGDVFQRVASNYWGGYSGPNNPCKRTWTQDSILTRTTSRTGDTVMYTLRATSRTQGLSLPTNPAPYCSTPITTVINAPVVSTLRVIGSQPASLGIQLLASSFLPAAGSIASYSTGAAVRNPARLAGYPENTYRLRIPYGIPLTDSLTLYEPVDFGATRRYAAGLGLTYSYDYFWTETNITELTAFRKGSQAWGTFFVKGFLLASRAGRPAATTSAFPNPFGPGLTAAFTLDAAQPVGVTLCDALGRVVLAVAPARLPAGAQQLALPTAGLPAGVYSLHLRFGADGHTEVLRVVKAE